MVEKRSIWPSCHTGDYTSAPAGSPTISAQCNGETSLYILVQVRTTSPSTLRYFIYSWRRNIQMPCGDFHDACKALMRYDTPVFGVLSSVLVAFQSLLSSGCDSTPEPHCMEEISIDTERNYYLSMHPCPSHQRAHDQFLINYFRLPFLSLSKRLVVVHISED